MPPTTITPPPVTQCAVLAGGLGTRLGSLTDATPKPLLTVGGRPFLAWLLRELTRFGVTEFVLLTGHLSEEIEAALPQIHAAMPRRVSITISREPVRAGTGGAVFHAGAKLRERFLLCNGDSVFDANLASLLAAVASDGPGVIGRMLLRQLFELESSSYTYLLADETTGDAVLIDPVRETVDRDVEQLASLKLTLRYTLETHVHADHVTGAFKLRKQTGCKVALARSSGALGADLLLDDGDVIRCGHIAVTARRTPGHTESCMTYVADGVAFTGDALLIRGCGRTDFQHGNPLELYQSVRDTIFSLPPTTLLYPAHDYKGRSVTTVAEERALNPRLKDGTTADAFLVIMANLKLAIPKKLNEAVPANLRVGDVPDPPPSGAHSGFIGGEGI